MSAPAATSPAIRDAASILVVDRSAADGPAVLMGQRGKNAAFMPSKYVFPGGAVDPDDGAAPLGGALAPRTAARLGIEPRLQSGVTPHAIAAAALRELAEETGLLSGQAGPAPTGWQRYSAAGIAPDPSKLVYMFRAITPPRLSRRFDARFLMLDAAHIHGDAHDFSSACDELSHLHWVPIREARNLDLPFITEVVLAELAAMLRASDGGPIAEPAEVPFFDNRDDVPRFSRIA